MRPLPLLLALCCTWAAVAQASIRPEGLTDRGGLSSRFRSPATTATPPAPADPADVRLLSATTGDNGAGIGGDICNSLTGLTAGNWFCMDGSGTFSGVPSFSTVGTVPTESILRCPTGSDCASEGHKRFSSGNYYQSSASYSVTGSWSACVVARHTAAGDPLAHWSTGSAATSTFSLNLSTSSLSVNLSTGSTTSSVSATSHAQLSAHNFYCVTYQRVGGTSDNIVELYVNGADVGGSATAALLNTAANTVFRVGTRAAADNPFSGWARSVLFTERVLTPAEVRSLADVAMGALKTKQGDRVSSTRVGIQWCNQSTAGIGNYVNLNTACWNADGLLSERTVQNKALRSEEVENASWVKFGSTPPVVTANTGVSPDGATTADRVDFADTTFLATSSVVRQSFTGTTAAHTGSVYVRGVSGSGTIYLKFFDGTATWTGTRACSYTSTAWTRCTTATGGTALTAASWTFGIGVNRDDVFQSGQPAQSVYLWGAQVEANGYASSYYRTTTAAATRSADNHSLTTAYTVGSTFSMAATVKLGVVVGNQFVLNPFAASTNRWQLAVNSNGTIGCLYVGASTYTHNSTATLTAGTATRISCDYNGTTMTACVGGTCNSASFSPVQNGTTTYTVYVGRYGLAAGNEINGNVRDACLGTTGECS